MIGQTISHYKILEKLGEGGMGVVYKAEDIKLKRIVALKLLPDTATSTEDDKARFLQEAQAASALNHPNVCNIHSVGEHDGKHFIDMEYVDGMTLRKKIASSSEGGSGVAFSDAVDYAVQIGDALNEAHAKGIVHRDIKAENIMLNSRNQIKVMDFGLAKLKGSMKLTRSSSTIGTLAYMAPEQLQGSGNDQRSDIFSFGVVLYEMLTGKTPFRGEHEAAMMYSIMNEEPEPIQKYIPDASPELIHILNRSLEKNPDDRYQHAQDMVIDLRRLKKDSTKVHRRPDMAASGIRPGTVSGAHPVATPAGVSGTGPVAYPAQDTGSVATTRSKKPRLIGVAVLVVALVFAGIIFLLQGGSRSLNPDMTTRVLQIPFTQLSYPSISPDAKWVAFPAADANGKWDIYYMHVTEGNPRRITNDSSTFAQQMADISPDGARIAYNRPNPETNKEELYVVSALGGNSNRIVVGGIIPRWKPDGQRIGYMKGNQFNYQSESRKFEFWSVGFDGSDNRLEFIDTIGVIPNSRFSYCWSPDGKSVAWIRTNERAFQELIIHDLATGEERFVTGGEERMDDVAWTNNDEIIFSSNKTGNTNLWMVAASGGTSHQITKGSGPDIGMKVSADGRSLVYLQQQRIGNVWLGSFETGTARQLTFDERRIGSPFFSPDGQKIAFWMDDPDPLKLGRGIYTMDGSGGNRRRITSEREFAQNPKWSPDGRWIAYTAVIRTDSGSYDEMHLIDASNPGTPKILGRGPVAGWMNPQVIVSWSPDPFLSVYLVTVDDTLRKPIFVDSMFCVPIQGGRYLTWNDERDTAYRGWRVAKIAGASLEELLRGSGEKVIPAFDGKPRVFANAPAPWIGWNFLSGDMDYIGRWKNQHEVWKYHFLTGKEERVPVSFPGFVQGVPTQTSADGKEVVYVDQRLSAKLVMIENLFR